MNALPTQNSWLTSVAERHVKSPYTSICRRLSTFCQTDGLLFYRAHCSSSSYLFTVRLVIGVIPILLSAARRAPTRLLDGGRSRSNAEARPLLYKLTGKLLRFLQAVAEELRYVILDLCLGLDVLQDRHHLCVADETDS